MNNKIKNISSTSNTAKGWDNKKIGTFVAIGISAALVSIILPEIAMAGSKFDIDAGVKAATDPVIKGIKDITGVKLLQLQVLQELLLERAMQGSEQQEQPLQQLQLEL